MRTLHHRRGFTLIELLVTMGLIILLLSLAIAVSNSATLDSYKINGAGDRLSQSLITAKARAARDLAPRGIRLIAGTDGYLRELVYIEQPDPWLPDQSASMVNGVASTPYYRSLIAVKYKENPAAPANPAPAGTTSYPKPLTDANNSGVYLLLTSTDYPRFMAMFQAGLTYVASSPDMAAAFAFTGISTPSSNPVYTASAAGYTVLQLTNVTATNPVNTMSIINPDLGAGQTPQQATASTNPTTTPQFTTTGTLPTPYLATFQTTLFGIYLPPRPLAGEPSIILSKNAAIDPAVSSPAISLTSQNYVDVLFAPAGNAMFRSEAVTSFLIRDTFKLTPTPSGNPTVYTWLTDPTVGLTNYNAAGEMLLVNVYPRTGAVTTKPVAPPTGTTTYDPFQFVKDSIGSGL